MQPALAHFSTSVGAERNVCSVEATAVCHTCQIELPLPEPNGVQRSYLFPNSGMTKHLRFGSIGLNANPPRPLKGCTSFNTRCRPAQLSLAAEPLLSCPGQSPVMGLLCLKPLHVEHRPLCCLVSGSPPPRQCLLVESRKKTHCFSYLKPTLEATLIITVSNLITLFVNYPPINFVSALFVLHFLPIKFSPLPLPCLVS